MIAGGDRSEAVCNDQTGATTIDPHQPTLSSEWLGVLRQRQSLDRLDGEMRTLQVLGGGPKMLLGWIAEVDRAAVDGGNDCTSALRPEARTMTGMSTAFTEKAAVDCLWLEDVVGGYL